MIFRLKPNKNRFLHFSGTLLFLLLPVWTFSQSAQWRPVGPEGGDVRSLAYDPQNPDRILLGTSAGQVYQSTDAGNSWTRFARIGKGNDYVLDNIIFDPSRAGVIYVAAWTVESEGGALFRSSDDGKTWEPIKPMEGKSIRALAMAPSDPKTLVVGALDGVFRSRDAGETWERISPEDYAEIKNIESLAIDPKNPDIIYAGTWHLPWKTADGGKNWSHMKDGIIDDSDVFSIIVDPRNANNIYLSACSGIYKSENAGALFHKIQGIPFSARRTRVLQQDPSDSNIVYAGTTEGLWKTADAGRTWKRMTAPNVIVNDVLVDPRHSQRVLLATDRSGVQASNNAGVSFAGSNAGFAHRQVATVIADSHDTSILYAGVINDKEYGGVFKTSDSGAHWTQMSSGLGGRDVFALAQDEKGTLIAGTNRGIFAYSPSQRLASKSATKSKLQRSAADWTPLDRISTETVVVVRKATKTRKALTRKTYKLGKLDARVADIRITKDKWYAATSMGIFTSANHGKTWQGGAVEGNTSFLAIDVQPNLVMAAGRNTIVASVDGGNSWYASKVPQIVTSIVGLCAAPDHSVWFASREGAYRSSDGGETWERISTLPIVDLAACKYDADNKRMLVTGMRSTEIFQSEDSGRTWRHSDTGWLLRSLLDQPGRLVATTAFDGVVLEQSSVAQAAETRSTEGSNKQ
jgi:photosystem II stability/assembly factor-like uncharacterized protein